MTSTKILKSLLCALANKTIVQVQLKVKVSLIYDYYNEHHKSGQKQTIEGQYRKYTADTRYPQSKQ